jgi:hypothetical protein
MNFSGAAPECDKDVKNCEHIILQKKKHAINCVFKKEEKVNLPHPFRV